MSAPAPSLLLGLTGLRIPGGIASVSRCAVRALDAALAAGRVARTDRVLLLEDPRAPSPAPARGEQRLAGGSQARFALALWRERMRRRHDLAFFDLVGLARALALPAPGRRLRSAIFVHGTELAAAQRGSRARALRGAWRVLTNSRTTAGRVAAMHPELAGRIRPVLLCIDPERVALWSRPDAPPVDAPREPAALIVGRMWSEERGKGHDALIEAWPEVRRRVPPAQLWIVGGGDDAARLAAKARAAGVGDAIRFLGAVDDRELSSRYRRAAVLAMPSRQEGFGLVYAEALWHGLPCIASSDDAGGEVVRAGETGLLVPHGDVPALAGAVASLLADPERRRRMGEAGARDARERFGFDRFAAELLAALEL